MKNNIIIFLGMALFATACNQPTEPAAEAKSASVALQVDYLISFADTTNNTYGYKDSKGAVVIPSGKYDLIFTDTFRNYAIVTVPDLGFVGIDRNEKILYQVFQYDNGPDTPSAGLFRVIKDGKIGYADFKTGAIVIPIQYPCAWPFEGGKAKVAVDCKDIDDGEHSRWESEHWFYIDKTGKKLN
ncbi:MAG: WG repeat-containing protein [Saprospiraceae bacterium]|nr:WG repeat-containing protein [Saprospiraceae bacterium]